MKLGDAILYLTTSDKDLVAGLDRAESETKSWGSRLGSAMKTVLGGVALGAVGVIGGAVAGVGALIASGMEDAREAIEIAKQTEAVIQSTGGAAGMTAQSVSELAAALSEVTNFEDDAIQAGENLLLTFTNIGSEVFPTATETMLDMSQALGQDMKSSAMQLGKALNDPVAGIAALSRVGVTFAEDQKVMIETMVEAGDVAGAQKVILEELAREFGGSAQAAMDPVTQLSNTWGNFKESLATAVLPVINQLATAALPLVKKAAEVLVPAIEKMIEVIGFLSHYIGAVLEDGDYLNDWLTHLPGPLQGVAEAFGLVVAVVKDHIAPALMTVIDWFRQAGASVAAQTDGPLAYFRNWIAENMPRIQQIVQTVLNAIMGFWNEHGDAIMAVVRNVFDVLYTIFDLQLKTMLDLVTAFLQILTGDWEGAGETLNGIVTRLWEAVKTIFSESIDSIAILFADFDWRAIGENIMQGIADGINSAVRWIVDAAEDAAQEAYDAAKDFLGISSPSVLAAEEIGKPFSQGIAKGIRDELQRYQAGIGLGLQGMMAAVQPAGAPNGAITINITVNGGGPGVGESVRGGVLDALRQSGLR